MGRRGRGNVFKPLQLLLQVKSLLTLHIGHTKTCGLLKVIKSNKFIKNSDKNPLNINISDSPFNLSKLDYLLCECEDVLR